LICICGNNCSVYLAPKELYLDKRTNLSWRAITGCVGSYVNIVYLAVQGGVIGINSENSRDIDPKRRSWDKYSKRRIDVCLVSDGAIGYITVEIGSKVEVIRVWDIVSKGWWNKWRSCCKVVINTRILNVHIYYRKRWDRIILRNCLTKY